MERPSSAALQTVLFCGIAVLYLPILVLIGYSFNASPLVNVWGGFSTAWYGTLLHNRQLLEAALLSLEVAVAASTGAVILGTLASIALVRFARFPGRLLLTGMVNAPLVMPEIITGITQLLLFVSMVQLFAWPHRGFTTIVISHVTFCTAYVTVTVQSRLAAADRSLEEAAMDLGATRTATFWRITFPLMRPGIIAGGVLAFTLSFDEFLRTLFLTSRELTLPLFLWSMVTNDPSPQSSAVATLITLFSVGCLALWSRFASR
jgi:putrescine transport system permease protein